MKNQEIFDLMARFETSGIARLKLTMGDTTLELEKGVAAPAVVPSQAPASVPAAPAAPASAPLADPVEAEAAPTEDLPCITAPLVGTFYAAPAPDKDAFVQVGEHVKKGATVCLLEAMKMMSEVTAPCDCVIEEIVAADGALVSFGEPLIRYREA